MEPSSGDLGAVSVLTVAVAVVAVVLGTVIAIAVVAVAAVALAVIACSSSTFPVQCSSFKFQGGQATNSSSSCNIHAVTAAVAVA